jgi:alpha-tubulin suppressor-like RCC1 family protein
VSVGAQSACALLANGTIECWGDDSYGELGDGGTIANTQSGFTTTPVLVQGITTAKSVGVGGLVSCALLNSGTVQCWGDDSMGELGDGGNSQNPQTGVGSSATPVAVQGLSGVTQLSVGGQGACAIDSQARVYCWGAGDVVSAIPWNFALAPVELTSMQGATSISVSDVDLVGDGDYAACATFATNTQCWGDNFQGTSGSTVTGMTGLTLVAGVANISQISASAWGSCALVASGNAVCWGDNTFGELGNGTTTSQYQPAAVGADAVAATARPTISGSGHVGATLQASSGTWPTGTQTSYQWFVGGVAVSGQTMSHFVVPTNAAGSSVSVVVSGALSGYQQGSASSSALTIALLVMRPTPKPTISGAAQVGHVLTVNVGTWMAGVQLHIQWMANGVVIKGATSHSLMLSSKLRHKIITVAVSASKAQYAQVVTTSAATKSVK